MVSKFEQFVEGGYAKELEENGYSTKAQELRALVKDFRVGGMPEVFPQEIDDSQLRNPEEVDLISDGKETRAKLIKVLSAVKHQRGKRQFNADLAETIKLEVGSRLMDNFPLEDLQLGEFYLSEGESNDYLRVNSVFRVSYTNALRQFIRAGYQTVGSIRSLDTSNNDTGVGPNGLEFFKKAFARPQPQNRIE